MSSNSNSVDLGQFFSLKLQNQSFSQYYDRLVRDGDLLTEFKHLMSESKNNKEDLKKLFRPAEDVSLFHSAVQCNPSFARYLIHFAIENDMDSSVLLDPVCGNNPLHVSLNFDQVELTHEILKYASVHGKQNAALLFPGAANHMKPFQMAIAKSHVPSMNEIFRFGVENGVDAAKLLGVHRKGRTALHDAAEQPTLDVLRAVVALATVYGVNAALLFQADDQGRTPLHLASFGFHLVSSTNVYRVDRLISLAKEIGVGTERLMSPDKDGSTPLHNATSTGDEDSVKSILRFAKNYRIRGRSLLQPDLLQRNPLHYGAIKGTTKVLEVILSRAKYEGIQPMSLLQADSQGQTPLHLCICNDRSKYAVETILQIAIRCKQLANVMQPDEQGKTPFHIAVEKAKSRAVKAIISATEHDKEIVQILFKPDKEGNTPLQVASKTDAETVMRFALNNGIDLKSLIDATKYDGIRKGLEEIFNNQILMMPWIWPKLYPSTPSAALNSGHSRRIKRVKLDGPDSSSDPLPDDVLFKIFEYVDVSDLNNCELVCHRWRDVLLSDNIWRKTFQRKRNSSLWRRAMETTELLNVQTAHVEFKEQCKRMSKKIQLLDRNWQTGKYEIKIEKFRARLEQHCIESDDDYILCHFPRSFTLIDRRTMKRSQGFGSEIKNISDFRIHNKIIVIASQSVIRVFDATTIKQVNELAVPNNLKVISLSFGHGILAVLAGDVRKRRKRHQLTVWRANSATDIQHEIDLPIPGDKDDKKAYVAMDEHYIVVSSPQFKEISFVAIDTLTFEHSMRVVTDDHILGYHNKILITQKERHIQLTDVRTKHNRMIDPKPLGTGSCTLIGANSKYLAVMNRQEKFTNVGIFDLHAAEKTTGCKGPLSYFTVPLKVEWLRMDETELICMGEIGDKGVHVVVIDFLSAPLLTATKRKTSENSLSKDDETVWRFAIAREIKKLNDQMNKKQ